MQILKQNYLSPGFQIKQSQMLKSVQTPLFLVIPILEKLLKNSYVHFCFAKDHWEFQYISKNLRVAKHPKMFAEDKVLWQ